MDKETRRQEDINNNTTLNLLNKNIIDTIDNFNKKYSITKSIFDGEIIDPGIKSKNSIISKLYRKHIIEGTRNFYLTDIKDIIRCTIILDNYNQVVPLIRQLRKEYPSLRGDVSENETGYIGVHLYFNINGLKAEMQISTKESWYAKQAGESIYEKWRNFNLEEEFSNIYILENQEIKASKMNELFNQYSTRNKDLYECQNMFLKVHEYTNLKKLKEEINAVLFINMIPETKLPCKLEKKYSIGINDKQALDLKCDSYIAYADKIKNKFFEQAKRTINIVKSIKYSDNETLLNDEEKSFIYLKRKYYNYINEELKRKFKYEYKEINYISKLNKLSNKFAFDSLQNLKNSTNLNTLIDVKNDLNYVEEMKNLEEKIRIEIITKLKLKLFNSSN